MCGIAGMVSRNADEPVQERDLRQMLAMIRHRGPDQFGIYCDGRVGLGSARLSIIDLNTGQQPIPNEDGTLWIVFNGEIFNYVELRPELEARGHRFSTQTDTEVILHLYEELGPECLRRLNGQFAIAIWDTRTQSLFLARDRLGVRPLFYTQADGRLLFGSEIKALLSVSRVPAAIDPVTKSILVNSEDGVLYRWDLTTNTLSQKAVLSSGIGEAYTPTEIGPDGTAYAINDAILDAVGN